MDGTEMTVTVDVAAGAVLVGDDVIGGIRDASAIAPGALRLPSGAVVRPLAFGVRAQVCAGPPHAAALGAAVLAAAVDLPPSPTAAAGVPWAESDEVAVQALALHLAGAEPKGVVPSFADVAVVMSRTYGWDVGELLDVPAQLADRLASAALGGDDDGWTRVVLAQEPAPRGATEVRDALAADLLRRAAAGISSGLAALGAEGLAADPAADQRPSRGRTTTSTRTDRVESDRAREARCPPHPRDRLPHPDPPARDTEASPQDAASIAGHRGPRTTATSRAGAAPPAGGPATRPIPRHDEGDPDLSPARPSSPAPPWTPAGASRGTRGPSRPRSPRLDVDAGPPLVGANGQPGPGAGPDAAATTGVRREAMWAPSLPQASTDRLPAATADTSRMVATTREGAALTRPPAPALGVAEQVAAALDDESDLRGLLRW
jgi:hypothetical protein